MSDQLPVTGRVGVADSNDFLPLDVTGVVESVVRARENGPLIAAAAALWIGPDDVVVDTTYGRGKFWTKYRPPALIAHDLIVDGIDFRELPEADETVDVVVFDPPYIPQGGRETSTVPEFLDRYGLVTVPKTAPELDAYVAAGIREAYRVLRPKGRLMVKCMDYVNGGEFIPARHRIVCAALEAGFDQVDEFVHHSGTGPQPLGRRQQHSRRTHTFLCVFQRPSSRRAIRRAQLHASDEQEGRP